MRFSPSEIERRRPVWTALSELFLLCDPADSGRCIAKVCLESGYSNKELGNIYYEEVFPVLIWNLLSLPACEWEYFSEAWLHQEILRNARRVVSGRRMLSFPLRPMFMDGWAKVRGHIQEVKSFNPCWRTTDVVALARSISDEKAWQILPILADALMEAGCDNEKILGHCRSDEPDSEGQWLVDIVLGEALPVARAPG